MLFRQRVKTVTHVVELLNFAQDRIWMQWYTAFSECLMRENFRWAALVQLRAKPRPVQEGAEQNP